MQVSSSSSSRGGDGGTWAFLFQFRSCLLCVRRNKRLLLLFVGGVALLFLLAWTMIGGGSGGGTTQKNSNYRGQQYWKDGVTQSVQTLYETPFARFQIHKVLLEGGKTTIDDWLWYDEVDAVNILVEQIQHQQDDGEADNSSKFLVLQQTKYGVQGTTLAVIGGMIEVGESPFETAQRELKEEMPHLFVTTTNQNNNNNNNNIDWIELGSYRTAANRGGGIVHTFLARITIIERRDTDSDSSKKDDANNSNNKPAVGELERQDFIELSRDELIDAVLDGKFQEVKWTATVALALLKISLKPNQDDK